MSVKTLKSIFLKMGHDFSTGSVRDRCLGIVCIGAAAYLAAAIYSFSPTDPSPFSASFPVAKISGNLMGQFGAFLAAWIFFLLGACAYLLPIAILAWVPVRTAGEKPSARHLKLSCYGCLFISLCILTALCISEVPLFNMQVPSAGIIGQSIVPKLRLYLGSLGTAIVLLTTMGICVVILGIRFSSALDSDSLSWPKRQLANLRLFAENLQHRLRRGLLHVLPSLSTPQEIIHAEELLVESKNELPTKTKTVRHQAASKLLHQVGLWYEHPAFHLFHTTDKVHAPSAAMQRERNDQALLLEKTLKDFGIIGKIVHIETGPVLTIFEFQPEAGTKISKVTSLCDDLALAMRVDSIMMNPVRGKNVIGIEIPNSKREMVRLGDIVQSKIYQSSPSPLTLALGKTIHGDPVCLDLGAMPHLLTAGATGSGKSVAINTFLCSIIARATPNLVKLILVDPKMLELSVYEGIPHLLLPVITEPMRASLALRWATQEMERRYALMQLAKVRHITSFNDYLKKSSQTDIERLKILTKTDDIHPLPYIVIVIDELADLMLTAPRDVESSIQRLAQKARASGIHLILATQRPSVDIITGVIKANLPCRAAFQVVSKHDSRTILDQIGADRLLGHGDMLLQKPGQSRLDRIQCAFVADDEVLSLVSELKNGPNQDYDTRLMNWIDEEQRRQAESGDGTASSEFAGDDDPKFQEAVEIAQKQGAISASFLQRQLKIGYNRAARIVESMEARGLVAKADGVKPRKWLGAQT